MTAFTRRAGICVSAAIALTVAGSALAADPAPRSEQKIERKVVILREGPGGPGGPGMGHRLHDPEMMAQYLRDILQLRPDQEPALKAFLEAGKPPMRDRPEMSEDDAPPKPLTTPQRLDLEAKRMAEHQAEFQKRAAAIRAFYAALSPGQQKAFDALGPGPGMGGPGGMGGPSHHGGRFMGRGGPPGGPDMNDDGPE